MPGRRSFARLPLLLLALACAVAAPATAQLAAPSQQRVMPNVVGSNVSEAMGRLAQMGIQAQVREMESRESRGTVVRQSPSAGTAIKEGTVAVLGVSTGPARTSSSDTTPAGTGGQTQPSGGGRTSGGIEVGVRPPRPGLVPDVRGMGLTMARIRLVASGLRPGAVDSGSVEGARPGRVIAQDPLPGTQVIPGRSVRLTLQRRGAVATQPPADSTPPPPPRVTLVAVPDLSGRTAAEARTIVGGARLLLGGVDSATSQSAQPGTVVGQRPAAGDSVEAGTLVTITVAREALVTVPSLTGRPPSEARGELTRAGLRPGSLTEREAPGRPAVLQQSVPAGTRVRPGTAVDLVVSAARPDTVVAVRPPAAPPVQPPAADGAPATQVDTVAKQPPIAVAPTPAPPVATVPTSAPRTTPAAPVPQREPAWTRVRWDVLAILAALLLATAGGLWWRSRVRRRVTPREMAPAAASPIIPTVTIRTASGGTRTGAQPDTPVHGGRVKVGVIAGAARAPSPEPGAAALQPARVVVRTVADESEDPLGVHPQQVLARGGAVQVSVAGGEPRLTRDEGAVILRASS